VQKEVPLGNPDILVCSVGTEIFYEATAESEPVPDPKWIELLNQGWDRSAVVECAAQLSGLSLQVHHPHPTHIQPNIKQLSRSALESMVLTSIMTGEYVQYTRIQVECLGLPFYAPLTTVLHLNVTICMGNDSCADFALRFQRFSAGRHSA